jgi:hypothetical protein
LILPPKILILQRKDLITGDLRKAIILPLRLHMHILMILAGNSGKLYLNFIRME